MGPLLELALVALIIFSMLSITIYGILYFIINIVIMPLIATFRLFGQVVVFLTVLSHAAMLENEPLALIKNIAIYAFQLVLVFFLVLVLIICLSGRPEDFTICAWRDRIMASEADRWNKRAGSVDLTKNSDGEMEEEIGVRRQSLDHPHLRMESLRKEGRETPEELSRKLDIALPQSPSVKKPERRKDDVGRKLSGSMAKDSSPRSKKEF